MMNLLRYGIKYQMFSCESMIEISHKLLIKYPEQFRFHEIKWRKFPDGTDNIKLKGYQPVNYIRGENILFIADFHSNDVTLSQFYALVALCESLPASLTLVLPFFPTATMERVVEEGTVATANCLSKLLANLPSCGKPIRLIIYDLHTLQNRFYLGRHCIADLRTAIPLLYREILTKSNFFINCIAFPDNGSQKRFGWMFNTYSQVVCGKHRQGDIRTIVIKDGNPRGKHILVVDDLIQTGGTLTECCKMLRMKMAKTVYAFVTHGVFPKESWKRFLQGGDQCVFDKIFLTNSCSSIVNRIPRNNTFHIIDITTQIYHDLYH